MPTLNHADFGYADQPTFERALTCGPIVRFEIRKHKGKVKHAEHRLAEARKTLQTELEQAMGENSMTRFIEGWVKQHEEGLRYAESRLQFLRDHMAENF